MWDGQFCRKQSVVHGPQPWRYPWVLQTNAKRDSRGVYLHCKQTQHRKSLRLPLMFWINECVVALEGRHTVQLQAIDCMKRTLSTISMRVFRSPKSLLLTLSMLEGRRSLLQSWQVLPLPKIPNRMFCNFSKCIPLDIKSFTKKRTARQTNATSIKIYFVRELLRIMPFLKHHLVFHTESELNKVGWSHVQSCSLKEIAFSGFPKTHNYVIRHKGLYAFTCRLSRCVNGL